MYVCMCVHLYMWITANFSDQRTHKKIGYPSLRNTAASKKQGGTLLGLKSYTYLCLPILTRCLIIICGTELKLDDPCV
jgi:hypothetical protein